jgi:transposase
VRKLATMLIRYDGGERRVWSVVRVPSVEEEDNRHLHRELGELRKERTRLTNRIHGFLAGQGVKVVVSKKLPEQLEKARLWNDAKLPPALHTHLLREWERLEVVDRQIRELEGDRKELVRDWEAPEAEQVRQLWSCGATCRRGPCPRGRRPKRRARATPPHRSSDRSSFAA